MTEANRPEKGTKLFDAIQKLIDTVAALRHPQTGCPWDLEQTHESLIPYLIDEAYEAAYALRSADQHSIKDELGDVLLQVVLHAQLASEGRENGFNFADVANHLSEKLIHRHPHVQFPSVHFIGANFSKAHTSKDSGAKSPNKTEQISIEEVKKNWNKLKEAEGKDLSEKLDEELLHRSALSSAQKIGKATHKRQFDWNHWQELLPKVREELEELEAELKIHVSTEADSGSSSGSGSGSGSGPSSPHSINLNSNQAKVEEELGDLLFTLAQLARHLGLDAEQTLAKSNLKFVTRYNKMIELKDADQRETKGSFKDLSPEQKENLWKQVKKLD